jgi:flavin-dependent dehydrogenase
VVVVGAGPAGAATAITLAKFGRRVLLLDERFTSPFKLGESLPPTSIGMVKHFLGSPEDEDGTRPCLFKTAGNVSVWNSVQPDISDFFFTSTGYGLCVERLAFDEALRSKAVKAGATLHKGVRLLSCEPVVDAAFNWRLSGVADASPRSYRARYVVDGSGRRAAVARALGVPITSNGDRLFAYAQWFSSTAEDDDRFTRIEAGPHGWWYSNRLPGAQGGESRRLVVFHSDKDLPAARQAASPSGFDQLLRDSTHIGPLLDARGYRPCGVIRGAPANSQRLQAFCGRAWMAVGDAAQAYDPLSSQGIDKALKTGSHAGHMIHYALEDSPGETAGLEGHSPYIGEYAAAQSQLWEAYLQQRAYFYGIQPRWSGEPFWQRRQMPQEVGGRMRDRVS